MREPVHTDIGQFTYDGDKYNIDVRLQYKVGNKTDGISLTQSKISDIEISVALNRLYSDGFIVYKDDEGELARIIGVFNVVCIISFSQYEQQGDGDFDSEKIDEKQVLRHTFIVDNAKIVDNDGSSITYCIYLKGVEYQQLLNHVDYSDYQLDEETSLVEKIKAILVGYGKLQTDNSFDSVTSGVKFNYISNGNDTVMSSIDYILQKQFFFSDKTDERMKFLVYDMLENKYGIFQFGQSTSSSMATLILSMNYSEMEEFVSSEKIMLASTSDIGKSNLFLPMSNITTRTYDINSNTFAKRDYESGTIVKFFGGNTEENKMAPLQNGVDVNITRDVSEWSNDTNIYNDFVDVFSKWDSIVVNCGGVINRKLMSVVNLGIDSRVDMSGGDTTEDAIRNLTRYKQLQGGWFVTKVRYIIRPDRGTFKQSLRLSRTNNSM